MEPDVLYAVRHGERNDSLKLSLRSLANLPHRRVFIAGFCPSWVRGVTAVEVPRRANKFDSIEENVRRGLREVEADEVIYMNDDFYITQPIDQVPITHGGPIETYNGVQELKIRMRATKRALQDLELPPGQELLTYDGVHMPLPLERDVAINILSDCPKGALWRTWYGNTWVIGGEQVPNTKYKGKFPPLTELPIFLSTSNHGLQVLRAQLEDILPKDCPYV